jgi:hypothetical protein
VAAGIRQAEFGPTKSDRLGRYVELVGKVLRESYLAGLEKGSLSGCFGWEQTTAIM